MSREAMEVRDASAGYELMVTKPTVPAGYKQSEVGVIPEDWDAVPLSSLGQFKNGINKSNDAFGHGSPFVNLMDVFGVNSIKSGEALGLVKTSDEEQKTYDLKRGDVIFIRSSVKPSGVGLTAVVEADLPKTVYSGFLIRFRDNDALDIGFKRHCFYSEIFRSKLIGASSVSANTNINQDSLKKLLLALPPTVEEQRAIATALSDVDNLLEGLGRLIAKKRDLKQASMQQLLTGQTRLPGFEGEWDVKMLGDLGSTYGGLIGKAKADFGEGKGYYVTFMNVISNVVIDCSAFERVKISPIESQNRVTKGDLLFNGSSETPEEVAMCSVLIDDIPNLYLNSFCFGFRLRNISEVDGLFLAYYLRSKEGRELMKSLAQGSTRYNLSKSAFLKSQLRLPTQAEQTAIAAALSDMDAEIEALEQRRAKTADLKQAMMQELLTGRTRLIKPFAQDLKEGKTAQSGGRKANVHFIRSVLAAEIVDQLHEQPTFGHVKFEKMLFLAGHLCEVDTGSTYHRDALGPYDNRAMRSIDSQLRKQKWFDAQKIDGRYRYVPMANRGGHKEYFERYFSGVRYSFEKIINTFRSFDTERCEIVATLYAAWSDLLREKGTVSDEMIVHEVLNNWHESKQRIAEDRWLSALGWMREKGIAPKG